MTPLRTAAIHDRAGVRKYINGLELRRFLAAADTFALPVRALCYLYAASGCRLSEALAVQPHSLNPEIGSPTVTFRTLKRRKLVHRIVPVTDDVARLLLQLPVSRDGRLWPVHRVTAWRWVKAVMERAGIVGTMATTKGLRHGFGMLCAARNVPLNLLQEWLGHASPVTTGTYVNAVDDEAREFYNRIWQGLGIITDDRLPARPAPRQRPQRASVSQCGRIAAALADSPSPLRAGLYLPAAALEEILELANRLIHLVGPQTATTLTAAAPGGG